MRNRRNQGLAIYEPGRTRVSMESPRAALPGLATRGGAGLDSLARAAVDAGLIVNDVLGREYAREQTARVDDAVLAASRRFEQWRAAWNEENRGKAGVDALKAYDENYGRICEEILKDFDGARNEIFEDLLKRRLAERGLSVLREGASWSWMQRQEWLNSQWQSQLADFKAYVAANPDDQEGIVFRRNGLLASWKAKNPGLEPGQAGAEINAVEFRERMEGFLARGDAAGARAWLAAYGDMAGLKREDSLSRWLLAHNNPGSVTVDGTNFAAYATPRDGLKAIMGRLAAYHKRGRRSVRAMISTYAPPSENDSEAYIAHVARRTGLDPEKAVDIRDRETLAALTAAILEREHSVRGDAAELLAAADEFLRLGEPRSVGTIMRDRGRRNFLPGFDPAAFRVYEERIRSLEAGQGAAADAEKAREILARVRELPIERRGMEILRIIQEMPPEEAERMRPLLKRGVEERKDLDILSRSFQLRDSFAAALKRMGDAPEESMLALALNMGASEQDPRIREDFKNFALQEIQYRKQRKAANDEEAVRLFMAGQKGRTPLEIQAALAGSDLSEEARARAAQLSWGLAREENPLNMQAASLALILKDRGVLDNEYEIQNFAARNALTLGQVKQIREYRGKAASVSISRINNILKNLDSLGDFSGPQQIDAQGYHLILEQIKPGHEPSDLELMKLLSNLYLSSGSLFWKKSVMDELAREQFKMDWYPDVKSWQRQSLEQELKAMGVKPSESNLKKLNKMKLFQEQGWPMEETVFE